MGDIEVLLTNDDGVEAAGIQRLYDALSEVASVTLIAPRTDQSAVGRTISRSVRVTSHDRGYVLNGTPSDCVVAGLTSLCPDVDVVIAGCNEGANLGSAVLGRSGTVSAAVESTFFDVPAIATSMYIPPEQFQDSTVELDSSQYDSAIAATRYLLENCVEAGVFDAVDYLNVNAPTAESCTDEMVVTRPSHVYRLGTATDGDTITLENDIWDLMAAGNTPDPPGTDRHVVMDGHVSVSPLTAPHSTESRDAIERLAAAYPGTSPQVE